MARNGLWGGYGGVMVEGGEGGQSGREQARPRAPRSRQVVGLLRHSAGHQRKGGWHKRRLREAGQRAAEEAAIAIGGEAGRAA